MSINISVLVPDLSNPNRFDYLDDEVEPTASWALGRILQALEGIGIVHNTQVPTPYPATDVAARCRALPRSHSSDTRTILSIAERALREGGPKAILMVS